MQVQHVVVQGNNGLWSGRRSYITPTRNGPPLQQRNVRCHLRPRSNSASKLGAFQRSIMLHKLRQPVTFAVRSGPDRVKGAGRGLCVLTGLDMAAG